jgi:hypothetical protein
MRYVIIRDDDTNALTPPEFLERLYRPLLGHNLPINLATVPEVTTDAHMANGQPEGFLLPQGRTPESASKSGSNGLGGGCLETSKTGAAKASSKPRNGTIPLPTNQKLLRYLHSNPGYHIVQHGLHHDYLEFDRADRAEVAARLERGTQLLLEAGFPRPQTFVAPYDRLSQTALREVSARFRVLSTGWFELKRLPRAWWPQYALKKLRGAPHWQVGRTLLLTHPGCLLSYQHTYATILGAITRHVSSQRLTVLVTHWWEYFRDGTPDEAFIDLLHETGEYLAGNPDIKVISFSDLLTDHIPLN